MDVVNKIWQRFMFNKIRYAGGKYYDNDDFGTPRGKNHEQCLVVAKECEKYGVEINEWVDAQFYIFQLKYHRSPNISQLHSGQNNENALKRFREYESIENKQILDVRQNIIKTNKQKEIQYGKETLQKAKSKWPELTDSTIIQVFADQFPENFLMWWHKKNALLSKKKTSKNKKR